MVRKRSTPLREEVVTPAQCSAQLRTQIVGGARYFRGLPAAARASVAERFRASHYPAGMVVYHEGAPATGLFFVVHGSVKLLQHSAGGEDVVLDILSEGALFGGLAPLGQQCYADTAVTQTDSCILWISADMFQRVLHEHPAVALEVLQCVAGDLADARQMIRQLGTAPVEVRIATALLRLADRFGEPDEQGVLIQMPLPQQDLAAMVGTTAETVSRTVSALRRAGHIDTGRQWVRVRDRQALERLTARP